MRTFHYFWCQNCQRTLRFSTTNPQDIFCPHCSGALNHELDISRPRLIADLTGLEPSPASRLLDSLAFMLQPPIRRQHTDFDRRIRWVPESANAPWITLQFVEPPRLQRPNIAAPETVAPPSNNASNRSNDNFVDAANEFIQEMTNTEQPGPPPAPTSAIEALPMVKITQQHLMNDTHCPVCKEVFEIDGEVKELPCKHLYHTDCIVPWLNMHNTCPLCRYVLRDDSHDDFLGGNDQFYFGFEDVTNSINWLRNQFLSLRPIRAFSDWTQRYHDFLDNRVATSREGQFGVASCYFVLFFVFLGLYF